MPQVQHFKISLCFHILNHSDKIMVMYAGKVMEYAGSRELIQNHKHPYTGALFGSYLGIGSRGAALKTIPGQIPLPTQLPAGCRFHPRCEQVMEICREKSPTEYLLSESGRHKCACFLMES